MHATLIPTFYFHCRKQWAGKLTYFVLSALLVRVSEADGVLGGGAGRHLFGSRGQNAQQRRQRNLHHARRQAEEQLGALQVHIYN
jgi:hypothetical protein